MKAPSSLPHAIARLRTILAVSTAMIALGSMAGLLALRADLGDDPVHTRSIDLIGRQRMLCLRVVANTARLAHGLADDGARRELAESLDRLSLVHHALGHGGEVMGARVALTPALRAHFERATGHRALIRAIALEALQAPRSVDGPRLATLRAASRAWVSEMDGINDLLVRERDRRDAFYLRLPLRIGAMILVALGLLWLLLYAPATRLAAATMGDFERQRALGAHLVDRYNVALHAASMGVWEVDLVTGSIAWDEHQCALYGTDPRVPMTGARWRERIFAEDLGAAQSGLECVVRDGGEHAADFRIRRTDGEVRWIRAAGTVLRGAHGEALRVIGVDMDVTETREAERREREATAALEEAQAMVRLGSWSFDVATRRVEWSRQCYEMFGYDPAGPAPDYAGARGSYVEDDARMLDEHVQRAIETGAGYDLLLRLKNPRGDIRVVRGEGKTTLDASGRAVRLFGTVMDVTAAVEREEALRRAQAQAEAANLAKSEFLANVSHELRTPMTAILGYADLLADPALAGEARMEHAAIIQRSAGHLLQIINDLLDVSKIDAGHMRVERVACSPSAIARDVVSLLRPRAQGKGLALSLRFEEPIPRTIRSDPTRLHQILVNLVGNAIKFTEAGGVAVAVSLDRSAPEPRMRFEVKDSGIGLTEAEQATLFRPFSQVDGSATRRFGGAGLGLSIAGRLAAMLGGGVTVSSAPHIGSLFTASVATGSLDGVPLGECLTEAGDAAPALARGERDPRDAAQLAGLRVLLAEDGPDNQRLIALHLRRAGAAVEVVENGQLAVDRLTREGHDAGPPFDAVLMDMQMPVLDGYAATARLRAVGYSGAVIALTAHAMAGDREKCLRAGCDDYATKPIDRGALLATILRCARPRAPSVTPARPATVPPLVSEFQGDPDMGELIAYFVATMPERISALESAAAASDLAQVTRLAHQLKGAGGGYGFPTITTAAQMLERDAHAGIGFEALQLGVRALVTICKAARAA